MALILGKYRGQDSGVVANVASPRFGAMGDGVTDDTLAFMAAIATGLPVIVPNTGSPYIITQRLTLLSDLCGENNPTLKFVGTGLNNMGCIETGAEGITVCNLTIDGDKATKTSQSRGIKVLHHKFKSVSVHYSNCHSGGVWIENANFASFEGGSVTGSNASGVFVRGSQHSTFTNMDVSDNADFGFHVKDAKFCTWTGCFCSASGLEFIDLTPSCSENTVVGCRAINTGDNGMSIQGVRNSITGNLCVGNAHTGIMLYGSQNTATGNVCLNNNQANSVFAGIMTRPEFGGFGQMNTITGNTCGDTQATPTQQYGISCSANLYSQWTAGEVVSGATYRRNGTNLYRTELGGTCGSTAPVHTSGTVSDGGVLWEYYGSPLDGVWGPYKNVISGNVTFGNVLGGVNNSTSYANTIIHDNMMVLPSTVNNKTSIIASGEENPNGNVVAQRGSIYMRTGAFTGNSIFVKTDDPTGNTKWELLALNLFGPTSSRPAAASSLKGHTYFNETTGKMNVCTGTAWVHADGTAA